MDHLLRAADPSCHTATLTLAEDGTILETSRAAERLLDYAPWELPGRHVSFVLPELATISLVQADGVNPRLAYLSRCGVPFRALRSDGKALRCELFFNRLGPAAPLLVIVRDEPRWTDEHAPAPKSAVPAAGPAEDNPLSPDAPAPWDAPRPAGA